MFEQSLRNLGFPANQIQELYGKYVSLDVPCLSARCSANIQSSREELRASVQTRVKVLLGERPLTYVNFGYNLSCLIHILNWWDKLELQGDPLPAAEDCLKSLQSSASGGSLPDNAAKIKVMRAKEFTRSDVRKEALQVLKEVLRLYDMEPNLSANLHK